MHEAVAIAFLQLLGIILQWLNYSTYFCNPLQYVHACENRFPIFIFHPEIVGMKSLNRTPCIRSIISYPKEQTPLIEVWAILYWCTKFLCQSFLILTIPYDDIIYITGAHSCFDDYADTYFYEMWSSSDVTWFCWNWLWNKLFQH